MTEQADVRDERQRRRVALWLRSNRGVRATPPRHIARHLGWQSLRDRRNGQIEHVQARGAKLLPEFERVAA